MQTSIERSPRLANRLQNLGTETAYEVAAEAAALQAAGRTIYSFHIGDENFGTSDTIVKACCQALQSGKTNYAPAAGVTAVRETIAAHVNRERHQSYYSADNVLVQPGGKPVILKFLLSTMNPGDAVAYPSPGYPIYESLIRFLGGVPRPYTYKIDESDACSLRLDMESLQRAVIGEEGQPPAVALIWNDFHNPTGYCATVQEHQEIACTAVQHNLWVLSDEAYFHIVYDQSNRGRSLVQQDGMKERTCLLLTCSKTWAMTGWRIGAAVGPVGLIQPMAKLAVNDEDCTNYFCQLAAATAFSDQTASVKHQQHILTELKRRRDLLFQLLQEVPGFVIPGGVPPKSTFYLWVDVTSAFHMLGIDTSETKAPVEVEVDYETFRKRILDATGVSFCTRVHFGTPLVGENRRYVRFAYSGIDEEDIRVGVAALKEFMEKEAGRSTVSDAQTAASAATSFSGIRRRLQLDGGRKPFVFCTRQIPQDAFKLLDGIVDLEVWQGYDPPPREVLLNKVKDCDGLISLLTDKIDEELLSAAPKLQVITQLAVGYDNIDIPACTRQGVRVSNTPGVLSDTVVETTLALIFACSRRVLEADSYVRKGQWKTAWHPLMLLGSDLHGSTLGVAGLGRIGAKVARVAKELGAHVIYHDVHPNTELEAAGIVERVRTLGELCERSDFISIHYNLTPETFHIFNSAMFARCKSNCILVNTARGPVVDQQALTKALQDKMIAAAGLDVFEQEPVSGDDPLLQCDNVVLFPHLGSASTGTRAAMSRMVGVNMRAYWNGEPMPQLVNSEVENGRCSR